MKAISIKQPYAALIMAGIKIVENRTWSTKHSGTLAIVSSKAPESRVYWDAAQKRAEKHQNTFPGTLAAYNGCILGTVELTGIIWGEKGHPVSDHPRIRELFPKIKQFWDVDCIGFILEDPKILREPIPYKGQLGIYTLTPEIEAKINDMIRKQ